MRLKKAKTIQGGLAPTFPVGDHMNCTTDLFHLRPAKPPQTRLLANAECIF
jgi:hypothetical protein